MCSFLTDISNLFTPNNLSIWILKEKIVISAIFHTTLSSQQNEFSSTPIFSFYQRDRTRRALLPYQNFDFLFYLGWSGSFPQSKHNIITVVQTHWSNMILIPRLNLALFLYNKKVEIYKTEFKNGKNTFAIFIISCLVWGKLPDQPK